MRVGFYYHIPVFVRNNTISLPSYIGLFLDFLAKEVDELVLFLHETDDITNCDYQIRALNTRFISLGLKLPAWNRFIFPGNTFKRLSFNFKELDHLVIRAPSPLAPFFTKQVKGKTKLTYLIVGDYVQGAKYLKQPIWRKIPIILLSYLNDWQLSQAVKRNTAIVNSRVLKEKYLKHTKSVYEIKTTTLTEADFFKRNDTCLDEEVKLLYTGSFSFAKGLNVLIESFKEICKERTDISLHFVGWEYENSKPVERYLRDFAEQNKISDKVYFHGFKKIGKELNKIYQESDIYVIPSFHEGFPRTIWEAMANSLPVICTNVGSIPFYLNHRESALIVNPGDVSQLTIAIKTLLENSNLRRNLIQNGFELAKQNTLEIQSKRIVNLLHLQNPS